MTINKDIYIEDLVEQYPAAVSFLSKKGIVCMVCGEPAWGTLAELAQEKGFDDAEIAKIVDELNEYLETHSADKIESSTAINELLDSFPTAAEFLTKEGIMPAIAIAGDKRTIAELAAEAGKSDEELNEIIKRLRGYLSGV